ncbi:MAG: helix-turn-helix transcriptional regulator [Calditrichaeota bacterium]|nr:helix-turn-helix transcriptional regulator [Calditrichota bacterium]MCB9366057.1 helix-turn-helix transcriptional regulator [Calditrichota bacterium]MCB9391817.1 helix-turn-helix transcriptional regulator [Calditrichota bacterium]
MSSSGKSSLDVGALIRDARKEAGLSQEALAELVRVNRSYLSLVENGRSSPTFDFLEKVSSGLNMRVEELLLGREVFKHITYSPEEGYIYRGLKDFFEDREQMLLMNPSAEELVALKAIQLHPEHDPTKRFFVDALLDLRRTRRSA